MPRLTNATYLKTRSWLKALWDGDVIARDWFSYLSPAEQWNLHDYFQVSKALTKEQLVTHRATISKQHPSLPHRAGKAAAHLDRIITYGPTQDPAYQRKQRRAIEQAQAEAKRTGKKVRAITVRAEVRPEIDHYKLARAVMQYAKQLVEAEKRNKSSS